MPHSFRHYLLSTLVISASVLVSLQAFAGITLGGTRVIYPAGVKQVSMSVNNTSEQSSFLIQSWVEQADGQKSQDFIVTPPLYVSGPSNENILRLMYAGQPPKTDRETLYYFNTKAIPSVDKKQIEGNNILMLASVTRIKLFLRPAGLMPLVDKAPEALTFHRAGHQIRIDNPTPYYITLAQIKINGQPLKDSMVPPQGYISLDFSGATGNKVTFRTINDYGAITPELRTELK